MLLPSDVARLVLGYLQEEGLPATSRAFIHESPNLKEYAEHTIGDGTIPACVFSIFGKGLTTILNEYVAAKAKESSQEVPLVMTSLWKKLDFTLNQIKSLQNSPAISASQRTRSRIGVANMARQRALTAGSVGGIICSSASEASSIISPVHTPHSMLGHSTPVCITGPHVRQVPNGVTQQHQVPDINRILNTPRDSPVQIIVSEHRLTSGPMSPGRRKWDTPRKRGGAPGGSSGPNRSALPVGSVSTEPQPEEVVDENFPQLVIQNARDKILGDRSLQEKLAENINKILANEPVPQTPKASEGPVEADQSIDEILGLQGEIHMSDDAIHDILEQTESDPAFQALFDLFDYNKTRFTDGETGDVDVSSSPEEIDNAGPSSTVRVLQNNDPDPVQQLQENPSDSTPVTLKIKAVPERQTRKSTASVSLKKTVIDSSGRSSRIENSSARLLVSHGEHRASSSATLDPKRKEKPSHQNNNGGEVSMEISETPLPTLSPTLDSLATRVNSEETIPSSGAIINSTLVSSSEDSALPEALNVDKNQSQGSNKKNPPPCLAVNDQLVVVSPLGVQENNTQSSSLQSSVSVLGIGGEALPESTVSVMSFSTSSTATSASASLVSIPVLGAATPALTSVTPAPQSSTLSSPPSVVGSYSATNPTTPIKATGDSSNVVSLKIIISDNKDEDTSKDTTLNRAISGISVDKIPTIYLSSPAKSPGGPGTPKANFDEAAQAVRGLQSSEAFGSPARCRAGAISTSPFGRTSHPQQRYIIQLPVDAAKPAIQESPASYFLVTPTADVQAKQVQLPSDVLGQPLTASPFGLTTPGLTESFSTGSTIILPSAVNPVVLPVSVVGQNPLGNVQLVSNQLVDVPNPIPVQSMETLKPVTLAAKQAPNSGMSDKSREVQLKTTNLFDAATGPSHKRILCFESSSSSETPPCNSKTTETIKSMAPNPSGSKSIPSADKDKRHPVTRTKPNILGGNKPKRRIEPVRCSGGSQTGVDSLNATVPVQKPQKESSKNTSNSQKVGIQNKEFQSSSSSSVLQTEASKKSELGELSQPSDKNVASAEETKAETARSSRSTSSDGSESRKDREDGRKEAAGKSREGRAEKRTPSQEMPHVTANKENEMQEQKQQQATTSTSSESRDFSPPAASPQTPNPQPKVAKTPSKTSSLAKQAAEMLQDFQGQRSLSTPSKKSGTVSSTPGLYASVHSHEVPADCPRTPSHPKKGKDIEGTPKHQLTPRTPDVPTCSPASEAGSENSINMAAHTLMILSRAAIARTGTPLKDSLRQDEAGQKSPGSSKNKKRKAPSPTETPSSKRELKQSPSKKKDRERKKLMDCFPHDLDVDKFLSSLHYDE